MLDLAPLVPTSSSHRDAAPNRKGTREFVIHHLARVNVGIEEDHDGEGTVPLPLPEEINPSIHSAAPHEELVGQALLIHPGPLIRLHIEAEGSPSDGVQGTVQRGDAEVVPAGEKPLIRTDRKSWPLEQAVGPWSSYQGSCSNPESQKCWWGRTPDSSCPTSSWSRTNTRILLLLPGPSLFLTWEVGRSR